jgi:hypothetical protein
MEGWAREYLRQRLGSFQLVRRFLDMDEAKAKQSEQSPALKLYDAWLKGGRKGLEALYDQMYPPSDQEQKRA